MASYTLCWGGWPPTISVANRRGGKIQTAMDSPGHLSDGVAKILPRSPVTSQIRSNTKCLTFPFNAFPPQNAENKRISSPWIDMIRVSDISQHRPQPEVTFVEVKVIWGHEVKLPIPVIWRSITHVWVGFSSITRKNDLRISFFGKKSE